ncbi:MAG: DAK2 domain-containing protein [Eubacteriales bacterium]|nr:DAK2 domain-containing protein [Eubacteriales bacterium]
MENQILNGVELHKLFENGYHNLKKNIDAINDLNVFPVPDGDTGTNMVKTFGGGFNSVNEKVESVGQYMQKLATAVLFSARGNSGIFFSQFVYGLYRGMADKETVNFSDFIYAFSCAKEDAYNATVVPTEGTILTLIREASEFLDENGYKYTRLDEGFGALLEQMKITLKKTPDMLPVLKEAGVVDSGAAGLVCFMEGMYSYLCGKSIEDTPDIADTVANIDLSDFGPDSKLEYGYCTEFVLQLMNYKTDTENFDLEKFTKPLEELGDSIATVHNGTVVKVHVHTFTPEKVLEYGRTFGEFITIKIENMSIQHSEIQHEEKREKLKYAVVSVASGQGIIDYFYSIGANAVIDGGQTNNPSVDIFIETFKKFDAEHIIVLPNNSNIVLTAKQAAELYKDADIRVIETKSIVEGYSALSMMNLMYDTVEEVIDEMSAGLDNVTTAYVTTAIRDSNLDGIDAKMGDFIGIDRKTILVKGNDKVQTALDLIKKITEEVEKEVIIVFYGENVTEDEVAKLNMALEAEYPFADIGFIEGKQDVYDFIISLE